MTNVGRQGLASFYEERFRSDPHALLDYCHGEIAHIAAEVSVDWDKLAGDLRLDDKKHRGKIPTLAKGERHRVAVFGSLKRARKPKVACNARLGIPGVRDLISDVLDSLRNRKRLHPAVRSPGAPAPGPAEHPAAVVPCGDAGTRTTRHPPCETGDWPSAS